MFVTTLKVFSEACRYPESILDFVIRAKKVSETNSKGSATTQQEGFEIERGAVVRALAAS
eukprot:6214223-Pleurochrysis_carterae.AAC.1